MLTFLFILVGAFLGAWIDAGASWLLGGVAGGLLGRLLQKERDARLALEVRFTAELESLRRLVGSLEGAHVSERAPVEVPAQRATESAENAPVDVAVPPVSEVAEGAPLEGPQDAPPLAKSDADEPNAATTEAPAAESAPPKVEPSALPQLAPPPVVPPPASRPPAADVAASASLGSSAWLRELLLGGNTVVRVGIVVLLVGVTLLLKYAAEHSLFPIELRMASGAATGLALVLVGVRLRRRRRGFGETLQGGGIATMYLVVFFSFKVYGLLPASLAFGLLTTIAALSAVLAVVQNAMALLVIGQAGGFLAPILASTGTGDHVALFSYYLVLNVVIGAVAWFRAWRPLNLLGFLFTFGIGTTWGVLSYRPEHLLSAEPFLVTFFLLYVAIPVLFALRAPAKGWVDGTLVFGAPLTFLALQLALVRQVPFGMAYTTVALSCLYLALTRVLRLPAFREFALLRTSFLALGVGFGTLAIPYAFDSSGMSAAVWAVEGAGLYFLGVRQGHVLSRVAGVVLQLLAGGALTVAANHPVPPEALPLLHGRVLAASFLGASSLFVAFTAHRHRDRLAPLEGRLLQLLILWALALFMPVVQGELSRVIVPGWLPGVELAALGLLGLLLEALGRRSDWPWVRYAPVALVVLLIPFLLAWDFTQPSHLLGMGGAFGWPLYFASMYFTLRHFVPSEYDRLQALYPIALWGVTLFVALFGAQLALHPLGLGAAFSVAAFGLALVLALALMNTARVARSWPALAEPGLFLGVGRALLGLGVLVWALWVVFAASGDDALVGYIPLLNPLELVQCFAFAAVLVWHRRERTTPLVSAGLREVIPPLLAGVAFAAFNGLLARSAHHFSAVPWDPDALWDFGPLQVAVSISWAAIGLAVTVLASRMRRRPLWLGGAALLGVVVVKLFALDLANLPTLGKIGTFLVVGLSLLVVGYFSPVPPAADEAGRTGAA